MNMIQIQAKIIGLNVFLLETQQVGMRYGNSPHMLDMHKQ